MRKTLATIIIAALVTLIAGLLAANLALAYGRGLRDYEVRDLGEIIYYASHGGVFLTLETQQEFPFDASAVDIVGMGPTGAPVIRFNSGGFGQVPPDGTPPLETLSFGLSKPSDMRTFILAIQRAQLRALRATPTPVVR